MRKRRKNKVVPPAEADDALTAGQSTTPDVDGVPAPAATPERPSLFEMVSGPVAADAAGVETAGDEPAEAREPDAGQPPVDTAPVGPEPAGVAPPVDEAAGDVPADHTAVTGAYGSDDAFAMMASAMFGTDKTTESVTPDPPVAEVTDSIHDEVDDPAIEPVADRADAEDATETIDGESVGTEVDAAVGPEVEVEAENVAADDGAEDVPDEVEADATPTVTSEDGSDEPRMWYNPARPDSVFAPGLPGEEALIAELGESDDGLRAATDSDSLAAGLEVSDDAMVEPKMALFEGDPDVEAFPPLPTGSFEIGEASVKTADDFDADADADADSDADAGSPLVDETAVADGPNGELSTADPGHDTAADADEEVEDSSHDEPVASIETLTLTPVAFAAAEPAVAASDVDGTAPTPPPVAPPSTTPDATESPSAPIAPPPVAAVVAPTETVVAATTPPVPPGAVPAAHAAGIEPTPLPPTTESSGRSGRKGLVLALVGLLVLGVVGALFVLGGGDEGGDDPQVAGVAPSPTTTTIAATTTVAPTTSVGRTSTTTSVTSTTVPETTTTAVVTTTTVAETTTIPVTTTTLGSETTTTVPPTTAAPTVPPPPPPPPTTAPAGPGKVQLNASSLSFAPSESSKTLTLTNVGGTPASWQMSAEAGAGLSVGPSSGSLGPGESATVTVNLNRAAGPGVSDYTSKITMLGGGNSSAVVVQVLVAS